MAPESRWLDDDPLLLGFCIFSGAKAMFVLRRVSYVDLMALGKQQQNPFQDPWTYGIFAYIYHKRLTTCSWNYYVFTILACGLKYFFYVHPDPWGNDPIWLAHIFQRGWLKPPPSQYILAKSKASVAKPYCLQWWLSWWSSLGLPGTTPGAVRFGNIRSASKIWKLNCCITYAFVAKWIN